MTTHTIIQEKTFYEELQTCKELDLRDNRGKHLDLGYILLGLTISLLSNRDGNLSSIHRSMQNKNKALCVFLGFEHQEVVSRSHLPIVLQKVNLEAFEDLLFSYYGVKLTAAEKAWFSADGKELRGSILDGEKRGEALVQLVSHQQMTTLCQSRYNGTKESEKPCLRDLIADNGVANQKITMDALHLCPATTDMIAEAGGIFIIGLKNNQKELLTDMQLCPNYLKCRDRQTTLDKGHGRIETRQYEHYDISGEYFDVRWNKTNFQSLFKVRRQRIILKDKTLSDETSYYLSNGKLQEGENYFEAIRKHWSVETNNHIRDVTLKEDKLKTKKQAVTKVLSGIRTLVVNLLQRKNVKNRIAQLEYFQDNFDQLLKWLRTIKFL